ncbi:hypothetical protein ERY430_40593 [Erythrobacter sp. EC-HK427]|nr:hypothetical protein ERY430_40593 [Erythrobacter sp. EC-HK427]
MVLGLPGHRIARSGDRVSGGGGNDFVRRRMQSGGGQNGGAPRVLDAADTRPSYWDKCEQGPSPSRPVRKIWQTGTSRLSYTPSMRT